MPSLQERLKKSHVGHWALAYIGGAWLTLQVADILGDQFQWPLRLQQSITVVLVVGFLVTLVLAWYHGEKGHQRFTAAEVLIIAGLLLLTAGTLSVLRSPDDVTGASGLWPVRPVSPATVVAVLPFHNLSGDPSEDYLASGLHEDVLTQLSRIAQLTVISRRSVLPYAEADRNLRQIGAELGARSLLEGSVRRTGNRLRVTVQLIDAVTDAHLWAETYDRTLDDVFQIQSEVSRQVAVALEATLTESEAQRGVQAPRSGVGAWELVQQARAARSPRDSDRGAILREEQLLREALALDPEYGLAWAQLSANFAHRPWNLGMDAAWGDSALVAARRAIELDPELALGHFALGYAYDTHGFLDGAEEAYRSALQLDPNMAEAYHDLGRIAAVRGRFDDAIELLERSLVRDPHVPGLRTQLGHSYAALGDLATAEHWFQAELELRQRQDLPYAEVQAWAHWWAGRLTEARETADGMLSRDPDSPVLRVGLGELSLIQGDLPSAILSSTAALEMSDERENVAYLFFATTTLGAALQATGDTAAARRRFEASREALAQEVDERDQYPLTYLELAVVEDGLGNRTDALRWSRRAFDLGSRHLHLIESYPGFDGLRSDPEFRALLDRMRTDVQRMRERVERRERSAGLR